MNVNQIQTENNLIREDGAKMSDLSFTRIEGYDVSIYRRNGIETMFIFKDNSNTIITMTKTAKKDPKKVEEINTNNKNIYASYEDGRIVLTMECKNEDAVNLYKLGCSLLNTF